MRSVFDPEISDTLCSEGMEDMNGFESNAIYKIVKKYVKNMETVIMFTFWFVTVYYVPVYVRNIFSA